MIGNFDVSKLSDRLGKPFTCNPFGWGDVNHNGKPDMSVVFLWANQYTGSETRIFEVVDETKVIELTQELLGVISPWNFDPKMDHTDFAVFDVAWAEHDCIYPPMHVFWVYDWDGQAYVDVTPKIDLSGYLASKKKSITSGYGKPFNPEYIEPMVEILLMYDKMEQREKGWQEFLAMTDLKNWPGTDAASLKWLKSDVDHFTKQYNGKRPFTPNNYCGQ